MIFVAKAFFVFFNLRKVEAICLWPFILIRNPLMVHDQILINHEKIHFRQQIEYAVIIFYILYISEFIYYKLKGNNSDMAYRKISFEKEAYRHEKDFDYLKIRKFWANYRSN
ncbi:MAG: hypothetical protein IPH93_12310 [Saprospiraceae bacterium]|nr:hypothetical protein [Saprospiraceae bacterium]MBK7812728.1 hypothetical protein [Saprospiraceae bacterium]MBK9630919.1 hypothetical protein [Saprospiraceae bacterium]